MISFKYLYLFTFLITGCKSNNMPSNFITSSNSIIEFSIINNEIKINDIILIAVKNNSTNNYYLPIDFKSQEFNPYLNGESNLNFYPTVETKGIKYFQLQKKSDTVFNEKDYQYFKSINDFFIIKAKETKTLKLSLSENFNMPGDRRLTQILNRNGKYKLKVKYTINKTIVESILDKKLLQELNNEGFMCYDGKITSNETILIIE
jgi:hypothetical protein